MPLAAAVTEQIITAHHRRWNPDWPETKVRIARDIGRHLTGYSDALFANAAGAACSIATARAGIHPDALLRTIAACRPQADINVTASASVNAGRAL
jgi:hypothetical protein